LDNTYIKKGTEIQVQYANEDQLWFQCQCSYCFTRQETLKR